MNKIKDYKKWHKPINEEKSNFHQGYFWPRHPEKCLSRENIYRSGWEFHFMRYLDDNPNIQRWASEPISITYLNPIKNRRYCLANGLNPNDPHNWVPSQYFLDFWYEVLESDGTVRKTFVEIKPFSQTQKPKPINESATLKEHRRFIKDCDTYLVNVQKWMAASKYCKDRGANFIIVTEKTLKQLGLL